MLYYCYDFIKLLAVCLLVLLALVRYALFSGNCKTSQVYSKYLDLSPFFTTPAVPCNSCVNEWFRVASRPPRLDNGSSLDFIMSREWFHLPILTAANWRTISSPPFFTSLLIHNHRCGSLSPLYLSFLPLFSFSCLFAKVFVP